MCGIIAVYDSGSPKSTDSAQLTAKIEKGLEYIPHRGPDATDIWVNDDATCGLGHARLAINDLTPDGEQPLHSPDGLVHAVVNGEIYDYDAVRAHITSVSSYPFKGHSDSELVIALYLIYGRSFLSHLRGEFALVIYDQRTRSFLAVRDRYGIKPLFWRREGTTVMIASEMKAFLEMGWEAEWDVGSIVDGGWGQDVRTVFKGVQKLRPGHYMTIQPGGELETRQYWDAEYPNKDKVETRSEAEMIATTRELLLESVRIRLRADVPVGVYLSGGIDSSVVAGMTTHLIKEERVSMGSEKGEDAGKVCCFSIAFDEKSGFDESVIAERTANHLGVKFLKVHMDEAALARDFEEAVYHIEHHNNDLNFVGKFALSEVTREHGYKVVLTGEGSDEQFGGYAWYLGDYLREEDKAMDGGLHLTLEQRKQVTAEQDEVIRKMWAGMCGFSQFFDEKSLVNQLNWTSTPAAMSACNPLLSIFSPSVRQQYTGIDILSIVHNNIDEFINTKMQNQWHPLHSAMYTWGKGWLANQLLSCLGDRVEMAHSIEARTPFLDHKLTEYINGLPPSMKMRYSPVDGHGTDNLSKADFIEKYALREATKDFITPEIYTRRKQPYIAPTSYPPNGPMHKLLVKIIVKENVENLGFLDWQVVQPMLDRAFDGEKRTIEFRHCLCIAEWIVLSKRFKVARAD